MTLAQKIPLSRSLSTFAQEKALSEINKTGQALPGKVISVSGVIVTVSFEVSGVTLPQVTMPLFGPEYIRYPIKAGDLGVAFPASVYIGGVSGLGIGTADLTQQANLSTLVWFPCGNKNWAHADPNAVTIYGPNGVVLEDTTGAAKITLTPSNIVMQCGGHMITINSSGVIIDGRVFLGHEHSGVQTGGGDTGPVV